MKKKQNELKNENINQKQKRTTNVTRRNNNETKITRRTATCCVISRGWSIDRWQFSDTSGGSWTDWSGSRTTRISSCWIVRFSRHNIPRHRRGLTYDSARASMNEMKRNETKTNTYIKQTHCERFIDEKECETNSPDEIYCAHFLNDLFFASDFKKHFELIAN